MSEKDYDLSCLGVLGKVPKSLLFTVCHALTTTALPDLASAYKTPSAQCSASVIERRKMSPWLKTSLHAVIVVR
jgi:hypothetical protein